MHVDGHRQEKLQVIGLLGFVVGLYRRERPWSLPFYLGDLGSRLLLTYSSTSITRKGFGLDCVQVLHQRKERRIIARGFVTTYSPRSQSSETAGAPRPYTTDGGLLKQPYKQKLPSLPSGYYPRRRGGAFPGIPSSLCDF